MLPKTPIGSLHLEFKSCGRLNCRCRRGLLHGPYFYRHWRESGRQRKAYISRKDMPAVLLDILDQRERFPSCAAMRKAVAFQP